MLYLSNIKIFCSWYHIKLIWSLMTIVAQVCDVAPGPLVYADYYMLKITCVLFVHYDYTWGCTGIKFDEQSCSIVLLTDILQGWGWGRINVIWFGSYKTLMFCNKISLKDKFSLKTSHWKLTPLKSILSHVIL